MQHANSVHVLNLLKNICDQNAFKHDKGATLAGASDKDKMPQTRRDVTSLTS